MRSGRMNLLVEVCPTINVADSHLVQFTHEIAESQGPVGTAILPTGGCRHYFVGAVVYINRGRLIGINRNPDLMPGVWGNSVLPRGASH